MARFFTALNVFHPPSPSTYSLLPITLKRSVRPFKCCQASGPAPQDEEEVPQQGKATLFGIPTSTWSVGLGTVGFLETSYLTYLKLTDAEAFCPIGGGSCSDVLNSGYSVVYGIPLPLFGVIAYGFVTLLSLQQSEKSLLSGLDNSDARLILLGTTTSMAADLTLEEIRNKFLLQVAVASIVIFALTASYTTTSNPQFFGPNDVVTLEPFETEITTQSTPFALSLAKHLSSVGAKMYGAFWCSHCNEQKQMFGREAVKLLDYVECFPDGVGKGRKMAEECAAVGIEGFPTWIINNKVLNGEQELKDLAEASGYIPEVSRPSQD